MQSAFYQLSQKLIQICTNSKISCVPLQFKPQQLQQCLQNYLQALGSIKHRLNSLQTLEQQYQKLEEVLQKQETDIRKHIGVEQQLKLYSEALKGQVEELEGEKAELLESSKKSIKELKKANEDLFSKLTRATNEGDKVKSKRVEKRSQSVVKNREQIRNIIKTEYIERTPNKNIHPNNHKYPIHHLHNKSCHQDNIKEGNLESSASDRKKKVKGKDYIFSNYTLLGYLNSNGKKNKSSGKKLLSNGIHEPLYKPGKHRTNKKKANKSIFSVSSVDVQS